MATVAELRMDVDSRSVRTADKDLDRLEKRAEQTERAANDMGRAVDKSGREIEETGRKAQGASRKMGGLEKAVSAVGKRAVAASAAFAGVALAATSFGSIKIASAFEGEFSKVETLLDNTSFSAGALNDNIEGLKTGLLELRSASGDSFENLSRGLFDLVSAGVAAEDSIRVLNDANVLAKAGATDVSVAVDGLTTSMNAYGIEASKSEALASKFFTTQKFGKTTVEELARGLGQVAPLAAQLGVEFDELLAAQAAATSTGIRQSEAYTGLKAALTNIVKPAKDAADEAQRLGVEFNAAALKSKGLTEFLSDIRASARFTDESFQKLFGSAEALNTILAITGGGAGVYAKTLSELSDETKSVATLQEAYSRVLDDTGQKTGRLTGTLSALSVAIGAGLAPAFGNLVDNVTEFLRGDDFADRLSGITENVSDIVGVLADNWELVEKGATAAAVAASTYLAINIATSVATTLNLAAAWRSVEKAVKGAAASTALLGAASGATGLRGLLAGLTGLISIAGRAVFSFTALRAAVAGVGVAISALGGPVTVGIVAAITAIVTFRKEIGSAVKSFADFSAKAITGASDIETALQATGNVLERRIEPLVNAVSEAFDGIKSGAIEGLSGALETVAGWLERLSLLAKDARQFLANMIPDEVVRRAHELADALGASVRFIDRISGFKGAREFLGDLWQDIRYEATRIELDNSRSESQTLLDQILLERALNDNSLAATEFERRLKSLGEDTAVGRLLRQFNNLSKSLVAANDNVKTVSETIDDIEAPEIGSVEQALRDQLAIAERLAEAAKGGKIRYEVELNDTELDRAARGLVEKAEKAEEELSFATARMLVGQIDGLEKAAQAMLDAEDALRMRELQRADRIASDLQGKIDAFTGRAQNIDFRAVGDISALNEALKRQFEGLVDEIDDASVDLNVEQLEGLYKALEEAGVAWSEGVKDAFDYGAERVRQSLEFGIGNALDDLIFNGGRGLGDQFNRLLRDAANDNFIDPISKAFSGNGSILGNIKGAFDKQLAGFQKAFGKTLGGVASAAFSAFQGFEIGKGLSDLLGIQGNKASVVGGGAAGGLAGAGIGILAGGPIGLAAAIGTALGSVLGGLFSKPSRQGVAAVFQTGTGDDLTFGQKRNTDESNANREIVETIAETSIGITQKIADLIGASFLGNDPSTVGSERHIVVTVDNRDIRVGFNKEGGGPFNPQIFDSTESGAQEAIEAATRLQLSRVTGVEQGIHKLLDNLLAAERPLEEIASILQVVVETSESGKGKLAEYALAVANAGLSAERIVDGVNKIGAALALADKPLSDIEQAINNIDDAVNPAIESLKAAGQAFNDISKIGEDALRTLGASFVDEVRDLNLRLKNETLANYKGVLDEIAQRQNDAFALFERGAISQGEFDFVKSTGGLQAAQFFKGLDDEARENLAAYLGILGEVSGDVAVARARLEEQFDYLIDNVEDTASGFEEAARNFDRLGQNLRQTAENIRVQFSGLTPRANVDELLGRVSELRNEGLAGNASALEALPQVVTSLVESARQAFGGTAEFARIRDIGLSALDDTAGVAEQLAKQNAEAAENARTDVELLSDIRNLIDDDRQLTTLQGILDSGRLTNQLIADQLQTFLNLFGQDGRSANEISIEELQAAASQAIIDQQRATQDRGPSSTSSAASPSGSSAAGPTTTDTQIAAALTESATEASRQTSAINGMRGDVQDLTKELRRQGVTLRAS